jgi:hypothetical protein
MVRLAGLAGLRATLEIDEEFSVCPARCPVRGIPTGVSLNANGESLPVELTLRVDAPDFEPKVQQKKILVPPALTQRCTSFC